MSFTNQREIYDAIMGKHNKVRKTRDFSPQRGLNKTLVPGEQWVAITNHEMDKGTASWYLTLTEYNRPTGALRNDLEIEIAFANNKDGFGGSPGGNETTYKHSVTFDLESPYSGMLVPISTSGNGSTVIIGGELMNMVHGSYLQVTVRNRSLASNFVMKGPFLTEEGWF